jgi:hypothetical protein
VRGERKASAPRQRAARESRAREAWRGAREAGRGKPGARVRGQSAGSPARGEWHHRRGEGTERPLADGAAPSPSRGETTQSEGLPAARPNPGPTGRTAGPARANRHGGANGTTAGVKGQTGRLPGGAAPSPGHGETTQPGPTGGPHQSQAHGPDRGSPRDDVNQRPGRAPALRWMCVWCPIWGTKRTSTKGRGPRGPAAGRARARRPGPREKAGPARGKAGPARGGWAGDAARGSCVVSASAR